MQNRYTGDIGDFGKYGLLRALTMPEAEAPVPGAADLLKLGMVWYLTEPENNRDGQQRDYLREGSRTGEQLRRCDSGLYLEIWGLESAGSRCVSEVRQRDILPPDTEFHEEPLDPRAVQKQRGRSIRDIRADDRENWHQAALERVRDCGIVFLDPERAGAGQHHPRRPEGQQVRLL